MYDIDRAVKWWKSLSDVPYHEIKGPGVTKAFSELCRLAPHWLVSINEGMIAQVPFATSGDDMGLILNVFEEVDGIFHLRSPTGVLESAMWKLGGCGKSDVSQEGRRLHSLFLSVPRKAPSRQTFSEIRRLAESVFELPGDHELVGMVLVPGKANPAYLLVEITEDSDGAPHAGSASVEEVLSQAWPWRSELRGVCMYLLCRKRAPIETREYASGLTASWKRCRDWIGKAMQLQTPFQALVATSGLRALVKPAGKQMSPDDQQPSAMLSTRDAKCWAQAGPIARTVMSGVESAKRAETEYDLANHHFRGACAPKAPPKRPSHHETSCEKPARRTEIDTSGRGPTRHGRKEQVTPFTDDQTASAQRSADRKEMRSSVPRCRLCPSRPYAVAEVEMLPCEHMAMCRTCHADVRNVSQDRFRCPECFSRVTGVRTHYVG